MSTRIYINETIKELQEIFDASRYDPVVLKNLEIELSYRKSSKAFALAIKVSDDLQSQTPKSNLQEEPPPPIEHHEINCHECRKMLRIKIGIETHEFSCPSCHTNFSASLSKGLLSVIFIKVEKNKVDATLLEETPTTLKEAYQLFDADKNTQWRIIESLKRKLIQQYHPDKVAALGSKLRDVAESEAKRINISFDMIKKARGF